MNDFILKNPACSGSIRTVKIIFTKDCHFIVDRDNKDIICIHVSDLKALFSYKELFAEIDSTSEWIISSDSKKHYETALQGYQLLSFLVFLNNSRKRLRNKMRMINRQIASANNPCLHENLSELSRVNEGGKYLRGVLVNLGYALFEDIAYDKSDMLALAYEVFQTSILIHDDIIDRANMRRGQETIHENYVNRWKTQGITDMDEMRHNAEALAICSGDFGMHFANKLILEAYQTDCNVIQVLTYFNNVILNTIKGEIIDVALPFKEKNFPVRVEKVHDSVLEIYRLKTAWYSLIGPLCSGAILHGCSDTELKTLEKFSELLGIAFQIKDDILGIISSENILGKNIGADIEEFKQTILYSYMKERSSKFDLFLGYYGKECNDSNLAQVKSLLQEEGALTYAEEKMNLLFGRASEILESMHFVSCEKKNILFGLIRYLELRNK